MMDTNRTGISLFLLTLVLIYLTIQLHEASHWIIAVSVGEPVLRVGCMSISTAAGGTWRSVAVSAGGGLITIAYLVVGLLMFRSGDPTVRRIGFLLVFITGFGRIGYELSPFFTDAGVDEASLAARIGISGAFLRVPLTALCVAAGLHATLKDRRSGAGRTGWIIPACAMPAAYAVLLAFSTMLEVRTKSGGWFFRPVLGGYPPLLVLVNLVQLLLLFLLAHPRRSGRTWVLLAAGAFNIALAAGSAAVVLVENPCAEGPRVAQITPPGRGIEEVIRSGGRILVRFDRAMDPVVPSFARDISYLPAKGPLEATAAWGAPDTLICAFSREVFPGEDIRLTIRGLRDAEGNALCGAVVLEYR